MNLRKEMMVLEGESPSFIFLNGDNKGQDMKEKLKQFMRENTNEYWYGCDQDHMCILIDKFFDQYQPERSKREDPGMGCGALNSEETH